MIQNKFLKFIYPKSTSDLFAFKHGQSLFGKKGDPAWSLFDLRQEFQERMGVSDLWSLKTDINRFLNSLFTIIITIYSNFMINFYYDLLLYDRDNNLMINFSHVNVSF